jgi:hypothetical protein
VQLHGFSQAAAAGIVGNLQAEGRLIPNIVEGGSDRRPMFAKDASGRTRELTPQEAIQGRLLQGVGLAQWTAAASGRGRRRREDWSRRTGLWDMHPPGGPQVSSIDAAVENLYSFTTQVEYVVQELGQRQNRRLAALLRNPGVTAERASDAFLTGFERPKVPNFTERRRSAKAASDAYDRAFHPAAPTPPSRARPTAHPAAPPASHAAQHRRHGEHHSPTHP